MTTQTEYARRKEKYAKEIGKGPSHKICTKCKINKPLEAFTNLCTGKWGKHPQCSSCRQIYGSAFYRKNEEYRARAIKLASIGNRKKKYGITEEEYQNLLKNQNNCCAICKVTLDKSKFSLIGQVDHNHTTNKIRGILCSQCNTGIGNLKEDTVILQAAIKYLEEYND